MSKHNNVKVTESAPLRYGVAILHSPLLLFTTVVGRLILFSLVIGFFVWYLPTRVPDFTRWSWSFFAIVAWLSASTIAFTIKPQSIRGMLYWRFVAAGFLLALVASIALALINWNYNVTIGLPFSTYWSDYLAFSPFEINPSEISGVMWTVITLKIFLFTVFAALLVSSSQIFTTLMFLFQFITYPFRRVHNWRQQRTIHDEHKRMAFAAGVASYAHNKSAFDTRVVDSQKEPELPRQTVKPVEYVSDFPWLMPDLEHIQSINITAVPQNEIDEKSEALTELFGNLGHSITIDNVLQAPQFSLYEIQANKPLILTEEMRRAIGGLPYATEIANAGDGLTGVAVQNGIHAKVNLKSILDSAQWQAQKTTAKLPFAVGINTRTAQPAVDDLAALGNCLIVGQNKPERDQFINALMGSVLMNNTPGDVRLLLLGKQNETIARFDKLPHLMASPVTSYDGIAAVLDGLTGELDKRFEYYGISTGAVNKFEPVPSYPRIFVIFEEMDSIVPVLQRESVNALLRLAKWGTNAGIQFITTAKSADSTKLPTKLSAELQSRVCFKTASADDSNAVVEMAGGFSLVGNGDMLYMPQHQARPMRIQCVEWTEDALSTVVNHWKNAFSPSLPQLDIDVSKFENATASNNELLDTEMTPVALADDKPVLTNQELDNSDIQENDTQPDEIFTKSSDMTLKDDLSLESSSLDEPVSARRESGGAFNFLQHSLNKRKISDPISPQSSQDVEHASRTPENGSDTQRDFTLPRRQTERVGTDEKNWSLPQRSFFENKPNSASNDVEIEEIQAKIKQCMAQHGVAVEVEQVFYGPAVTMYGVTPGWKHSSNGRKERVKVKDILGLEKDLALALGTPNIRIEPVVTGESVVGIEVPNRTIAQVNMRSVIDTEEWSQFEKSAEIPLALGLGRGGVPAFIDLTKMPHLLIAGATGSGKSVCVNTLITSVLTFRSPSDVRMILIDPKRVELKQYSNLPHLYSPVVVEPEDAVLTLKALLAEMDARLKKMEEQKARDIATYNRQVQQKMPYLLTVIDELADLMLTAGNEVERLLTRLAHLGRATGIHLIVATQRPSVDVVTGSIKVNFASRISFTVTSLGDSRTILDRGGGEKLLGRGDMLFLPSDQLKPTRLQGVFMKDSEMDGVVSHWLPQESGDLPQLEISNIEDESTGNSSHSKQTANHHSIFEKAVELAQNRTTLSVTHLQTRLGIGYPKAARLMDELEENGIVAQHEQGKPRRVIVPHI